VFHRAPDSCDCVVWLALVIRTRVVVVVTPLIPVVIVAIVVVVARVVLALAANGVLLGVCLVFFVGP
jgi:hypothetical protein